MDGTNLRNSFKKDSRSLETFGDALIQTKSVKILRKSFSKKKKKKKNRNIQRRKQYEEDDLRKVCTEEKRTSK